MKQGRQFVPILKRLWPLAMVFAIALIPLAHLWYPPGRDQAAFLVCARLLATGKVLYRECWDVKGPLTYLVVRAFLPLSGPLWLAVRWPDVLIMWGVAGMLYVWLPLPRLERLGAGLLWILLYTNLNYWNTAQAEGFSLPFVLASVLLWTSSPSATRVRFWGAGLLLGVAAGFKPTALGVGLLAFLLCEPPWQRPKPWLLALAGILMGAGGWVIWLYVMGALPAYADVLQFLGGPYQKTPHPQRWLSLIWANRWLLKNERLLPTVLALLIVPRAWSTRAGKGLIALLLGGLFSVHLQGRYWAYHWVYVLPSLAGLALWSWQELRHRLPPYMSRVFLLTLFGVALLYLPTELLATVKRSVPGGFTPDLLRFYGVYGGGHFSLQGDWEVAQFVRSRTAPTERIWVWGFEPAIYLFADRAPATRFIYDLPLSIGVPNPWTQQWQQEALQALVQQPPRYIIVATQDVSAVEREDSYTQLRRFPEFAAWLAQEYTLQTQVERFLVYRRSR